MAIADGVLNLTVSNMGTDIVSTLQIKLSFLDAAGRLAWVEPYYLQNNLVPGELRQISVPLSNTPSASTVAVSRVSLNGQDANIAKASLWPIGLKLQNQGGQILIDYDAMTYRPID